MKNISQSIRKKFTWEFFLIALFFLAALVFLIIRGDDIYIQTFDNLDSNIAWEKMLKDNHLYFSTDEKVPLLGGVDRNLFSSEWKCYTWLYMLFSPFYALVIGWFLKIIISMIGFCAVGKLIYPDYEAKRGTILFCGFLYGLLPTFPTSAFSFASLPLLLWLVIQLYQHSNYRYMLAIFIYPLISSATTFGIFACGFIFVFFICNWIYKKRPAWRMLIAAFVLGFGYIITEWRLFYSMLFSDVESIRSTFETTFVTFPQMIKTILEVFISGHHHSGSLHSKLVLPVCGIYFLYLNISYIRQKKFKYIFSDVFNWLMIWIGFNCVMYGVDSTSWFYQFIATVIPPLEGFSFARTLWFNPFLWYFSFMVVLCRLPWKPVRGVLSLAAFLVLCCSPYTYNSLNANLNLAIREEVLGQEYYDLTFSEFYSEDLFSQMKEDIQYDGEWSIAFGMHPSVLQYNAISTLDGYLSMYPATYKEEFRALIAPGLSNDPNNAYYYDSWGGRAYIFSNEIGYEPTRTMSQQEADLGIDPDVFREMGGKYVFSRVSIRNASDLGMSQVGVYTHEDSPYTIYVYQAD